MKTTLEIPDALMWRIKLRAVQRSQKRKDAITQLLDLGMMAAPEPVPLKGGAVLTIRSIAVAIDADRQ